MLKMKETKKKHELVRLAYRFKFEKQFKEPCQEWLDLIETMCNEILRNYTKKEDQLMTAALGTRPKRRLTRVMDALKFEYPDYERLNKGAEGVKRKRIVSILSKQTARMVKEDEKSSKKRKSTPEPKAAASKKRKAESPKPKIIEAIEETPSTPPGAEITEILKVMTESLPIMLLSPLGPELMKLLQKKDEPSATKKKADGQKKRRIVTVMQAIERTPPSASASKITPIASAEANPKLIPLPKLQLLPKLPTLRAHCLGLISCSRIWLRKRQLRLQRSWPQCLAKGERLPMLLRKKGTSTFGTWSVKNYPRPKRRSYWSMVYPVARLGNGAGSGRVPAVLDPTVFGAGLNFYPWGHGFGDPN
jgi:hypothetical protein